MTPLGYALAWAAIIGGLLLLSMMPACDPAIWGVC